MAEYINTNTISLIAQNNLSKSQSSLGTAIERLSSGLRINSAADDAAGEAIANRFTSNINGLNQASSNANDGISLAQTTEGALDQINTNLQDIRTLTVQAQTGTNSASDLQSIQDEITQDLSEVDRISQQTDFNGVKVLSDNKNLNIQVGADDGQTISIALQQVDSATLGLGSFNVNGAQGQTTTVQAGSVGDITGLTSVASNAAIPEAADTVATGTSVTIGGTTATTVATPTVTTAGGTAITGGTLVSDSSGNYYVETGAGSSTQFYKATGINATTGALTVSNTSTLTPGSVTIGGTTASPAANATITDASGNAISGGTLMTDGKGNYYVETGDVTAGGTGTIYKATSISSDGSTITVGDATTGTLTANGAGFTSSSDMTLTDISGSDGTTGQLNLTLGSTSATINDPTTDAITFQDDSGKTVSGGQLVQDATSGKYYVATATGLYAAQSVSQSSDADGNVTTTITMGNKTAGTATDVTGAPGTTTFKASTTASTIDGTNVSSISISDISGKNNSAVTGGTLVEDSNGNYYVQDSEGNSYAATVSIDPTSGAATVTADSTKAIANPATTNALATLDQAISQVDTFRSNLGAIQNRLDSTMSNISTTTTNLSQAQSVIEDADYATEVSDMSKAQILQQAGTSVLAQANQIPQTVLSLLK